MYELLEQLRQLRAADRAVALCRLVETRGSTPQKAGAAMLVLSDGSQRGTLGGGCVEAEVKRRALGNLAEGAAEVVTFQLDSDYGWDDGLICGGRMQVLIEPLRERSSASARYVDALTRLAERGGGLSEVIVFDAEKSGLHAPVSYLFDAELQPVADTLAAGNQQIPPAVRASLRPLSTRPRPGAASGIAVLPLLQRCRLVIVGGGHVGQAVGNWAAELDFDVWVIDDREEYVSAERFPRAQRRIAGAMESVLPALDITPETYCLIVTRGHNHDQEALHRLVDRGACYVGLIGSRRKIKLIMDNLAAEGVSSEALSGVYAPVGIDIGSQTVPEIAVSILAELVAHRNLGGHVPGRDDTISVENTA